MTGRVFETEEPFTDTDDYYVECAFALGVINGRGGGIFDPDSPITRKEAAVMLLNSYGLFGMYTPQEKTASFGQIFRDVDKVAEWAYESVTIMYQFDVMNGIDGNVFSPLGYYTREQCIATFLRLYKNSPSRNVLLLYEEARERILGVTLPTYHIYNEFDCDKYSVYYGGQTGTSHGESYSLWIVYRSGGRRKILHTGDGLPPNSLYRNDIVIYDLAISVDESTLTFKRDFNDVTYNYSVELMTAKITEIH